MSYSFDQLREAAERIARASYHGIPGVIKYESSVPGPVIGITIATHGNEPAGLAAARTLMDILDSRDRLKRGTVFIVLNNIEACRKYFAAKTAEERRMARFVDMNMNRLPCDLSGGEDHRYEIRRARELLPIWSEFDIGLDIHSTSQEDGRMILSLGSGLQEDLIRGFPIERIVSNIDRVQIGCPAAHFYGGAKPARHSLAIECGPHEHASTYETAVSCAQTLLVTTGLIAGALPKSAMSYEEYAVRESVLFPGDSYSLEHLFKNFERIAKGQLLASGDGPDIVAAADGHIIFASQKKPDRLDEEVMFITAPARPFSLGAS